MRERCSRVCPPSARWSCCRGQTEIAKGFSEQFNALFPQMVRMAITPEWVGLLDIEGGRFPSAWEQPPARTAPGV